MNAKTVGREPLLVSVARARDTMSRHQYLGAVTNAEAHMMTRRIFVVAAAALFLTACGGARRQGADQPATTLRVENQSFLDMTIYLIAGAQRVRLGLATGNSTTTLRIPQQYVFGASSLRFLADPIGSNRTPISESITVTPGDEVGLIIPPT